MFHSSSSKSPAGTGEREITPLFSRTEVVAQQRFAANAKLITQSYERNKRETDFGMSRDTQLTNVAVYLMFVSAC